MIETRRLTPESKVPLSNLSDAANTTDPLLRATANSERIPPAVLMIGVASTSVVDVKWRLQSGGMGESETMNWKFPEVKDPVDCMYIRLQDPLTTGKIVRLLYTHSGTCVIALDGNAAHRLWKWKRNVQNPFGLVKTNFQPQISQAPDGTLKKNDTSDRGQEEVVPCLALSENDSYVMSASGGKVTLFNLVTFEVMENCIPPLPTATCLAFHALDNNIIAIGMEDSTIQIFNFQLRKLNEKLTGHQKRITGLAFSRYLNILVSSGADAQLCVWDINGWKKCKSKAIHSHSGILPSPLVDTTVQFHNINQVQVLVVQESQIAIYDAFELEYVCHWTPRYPIFVRISSATYSCDGLLVYASFFDGSIRVFDSEVLMPHCHIAPSAFIPNFVMATRGETYALVITANPHEPKQIAVGFSDGGVYVIEPAT